MIEFLTKSVTMPMWAVIILVLCIILGGGFVLFEADID